MRPVYRYIVGTVIVLFGTALHAAPRDEYIALALQGNVAAGLAALEVEAPSEQTRDFARVAQYRFGTTAPAISGNDLFSRIASIYRRYWHQALLYPQFRARYDWQLRENVAAALRQFGHPHGSDPLVALADALAAEGIHSVTTRSAPLYDLVAWKHQRSVEYEVELTDGTYPVTVVFMSDMLSYGWSDYATMGTAFSGGWVGDGVVYCLEEAYDTRSERFLVSYLKHETRHLVDREKFEEITHLELEYRAKLTELAFADKDLPTLVRRFSSRRAANPDSPHAAANNRVIETLAEALGCDATHCDRLIRIAVADPVRLRRLAREVLAADTARRS